MSIYIVDGPEPVIHGGHRGRNILAESSAYHRVCREIERYARQEVHGRSFLISGHRGSGKTTLALKAVQDMQLKFQDLGLPVRLLLVHLHGPDLLPPKAAHRQAVQPTCWPALSAPGSEQGEAEKFLDDTSRVLTQVTIAIYQAVAEEISSAYREQVEALGQRNLSVANDLSELAAQLRVELDNTPTLDRLRQFWDRIRRLEHGVLFPTPSRRDQGLLELIAVASSAQAYRLVAGKYQETQLEKTNAGRKDSLVFQAVTEIKHTLAPLLALLVGGIVTVSVKDEGGGVLAALAGTAAGLATAMTLNYSTSRSHDLSMTREVAFLPDTSVASLDRMLPSLVARLRTAGLAPIFMVDELDKVDDLPERMGQLVRHLKHLVTESAFFCFLADRDYIEHLGQLSLATPYPQEHTYFTDRLYVLYRPSDLHQYLQRLLTIRDAVNAEEEVIDREVLPYVLLERARLHPFDLRRELARIRNDQGAVSLERGALVTQLGYRCGILIQVAVEWLLDEPALRERLTQDQDFSQLTYDSLYYPSRKWALGELNLDLSRAAFRQYLATRMCLCNVQTGSAHEAQPEKAGVPAALSPLDEEFLYTRLRQLVHYLQEPQDLHSEIRARNPQRFPEPVLAALPISGLLTARDRDHYTWCYDVYGRSVNPPGVEAILASLSNGKEILIGGIATCIAELSKQRLDLSKLAVEFKVLSTTPAWSAVQTALQRLDRLRRVREPYPDMEQDATIVWEYASLLQRSARTLALALIGGAMLGRLTSRDDPGDKMLEGLRILTSQLALSHASEEETGSRLRSTIESFLPFAPQLTIGALGLDDEDVQKWIDTVVWHLQIVDTNTEISRSELAKYSIACWKAWFERFTRFFRDGTAVFPPTAEDLLCAAGHVDPALTLKADLTEVSLGAWTEAFVAAVMEVQGKNETPWVYTPIWLGIPALIHLGFAPQALSYPERILVAGSIGTRSQLYDPESMRLQVHDWTQTIEMGLAGHPGERPGTLILAADGASMTRNWKPSFRYAAFLTTAEALCQLYEALQRFGVSRASQMPIHTLMIELTNNMVEQKLGQPLAEFLNTPSQDHLQAFLDLPIIYLLSHPPAGDVPPSVQFVVSPQSLDEAMEKSLHKPERTK